MKGGHWISHSDHIEAPTPSRMHVLWAYDDMLTVAHGVVVRTLAPSNRLLHTHAMMVMVSTTAPNASPEVGRSLAEEPGLSRSDLLNLVEDMG